MCTKYGFWLIVRIASSRFVKSEAIRSLPCFRYKSLGLGCKSECMLKYYISTTSVFSEPRQSRETIDESVLNWSEILGCALPGPVLLEGGLSTKVQTQAEQSLLWMQVLFLLRSWAWMLRREGEEAPVEGEFGFWLCTMYVQAKRESPDSASSQ